MFFTPAVVPCTFTVTVHDAWAASVTPERLTCVEPVAAAAVPPQVLVNPFGVATTSPAGKLSVNPTPVKSLKAFG